MPILISNKGLNGRLKISGNSTGAFKARYVPFVDADVQAFFNRVTVAGGTLSATEQSAVTTLVVSLKSTGVWTLMKAIYPMVGSSAAACAQNLKSSSFTGAYSGGWTFLSSGVQGNGTNAYMNTFLLASTNLLATSAHLSVYINTTPNGQMFLGHGTIDGILQTGGSDMYGALAAGYIQVGTTANAAFYMVNRQSISNLKLIKNASILLSSSNTGTAYTSTQNMLLNAYNTTSNINNCRYALASIGDGLTDTNASDFYTAVQAFQTTLGRQV
jgi:hypothetical protein